jgi:dipeptidyl aminopeptidase/acylaminoacyl peptidase
MAASLQDITPFHDLDRFIALPRLGRLTMSSNGKRLVTLVYTLDSTATGYTAGLWEIDPAGICPARQIVRAGAGSAQAAFSGTGDLYFISSRPDPDGSKRTSSSSALWVLPAAGGEARKVASRLGGIDSLHVGTDTGRVVVAADVIVGSSPDDDALRWLRRSRRISAILHTGYPIRYWGSDLGLGRPRLLVVDVPPVDSATDGVGEPRPMELRDVTPDIGSGLLRGGVAVAPDGSFLLAAVTTSTDGLDAALGLCRVDLETGERTILLHDGDYDFTPGPISPDNTKVVLVVGRRPSPECAPRDDIALLDLHTGSLTCLTEKWDRWAKPLAWFPNGQSILAVADDEGRSPLFRIDLATGTIQQLTHDDAAYAEAYVHPDGQSVYATRSTCSYPTEVVRIDVGSRTIQRLRNPAERPALPGRLEEVTTVAADGTTIRGWLALPRTASATTPVPLSLWIHGGPLASWNSWSWLWNPWTFVADGYAVLLPDPALSTGYGQDFLQRGWGQWGAEPYTDLMGFAETVRERADIDGERAAVMGGSFGGYMANWIAGHTDRFAAIVTQAPLWALDRLGPTSDAATYWARLMTPELAYRYSPHRFVGSIATPMLVIHGDRDYRVPISEGVRLWYELLAHSARPAALDGTTDHRMLYFPDEGHWVQRPQHAKLWYEVTLGFVNQHVRGATFTPPPTLAPPLPVSGLPADGKTP